LSEEVISLNQPSHYSKRRKGGDPNHRAESGMVRKVDSHGAYDHIIPPIEEAWAHLPVLAFPNA